VKTSKFIIFFARVKKYGLPGVTDGAFQAFACRMHTGKSFSK